MKVFSNSSPIMYLAKIEKLSLLKELFSKIIIPKEVYEEVVEKGKEGGFLDSLRVEKAVKEGWIKINKENREMEYFREIGTGESALISLAKKEKADLVLIDDASARIIAESFGLNVKGTLYVLLLGCKNGILNKKEVKELIKRLIDAGFRISAEIYTDILDKVEKL